MLIKVVHLIFHNAKVDKVFVRGILFVKNYKTIWNYQTGNEKIRTSCRIQSTSGLSNFRYLKLSICRTFSLLTAALITSFGITNPAFLNFDYAKLFSMSLHRFSDLLFISYLERFHFTHSIRILKRYIRKLWSNVYLFLFRHKSISVSMSLMSQMLKSNLLYWLFLEENKNQ